MPITIPNPITTEESVHPLPFDIQNCRITRIECFRYDREYRAKLLLRDETDICGLIAISTNTGVVGLKEFVISSTCLTGDFTMWAAHFQRMKGLPLAESISYPQLKQHAWGQVRVQIMESAVMDLIDKINRGFDDNKVPGEDLDRAYLYDHAQAYISF
ncbi:hypothetical protein A8990_11135 [Paenibacillus taihuensis]|uniref:Uncharacterized protein n=1 Tax=Paenibacillus taihuensis TaxID=1156355 RepID=A0A3D9SAQ6_9BACL|nr:hypothetical protein [Paenibacillus taihuensis]REE86139.1 hypothetical protein A8990_11135 [Paenibacillus taihuensis]